MLPRDLTHDLPSARIQPAASPDVVRRENLTEAGSSTPVLFLRAPSRLTWSARFPDHAELEGSVAIAAGSPGVTVRIGIADDRSFEELVRLPLAESTGASKWAPIRADLGAYSGWKWSLFYRPSRVTWSLIVAADPTPGGAVLWRTLRLQKKQ